MLSTIHTIIYAWLAARNSSFSSDDKSTRTRATLKMILPTVFLAVCLELVASTPHPPSRQCHDMMLSVEVTGPTYDLDIVHVDNNIEAVQYAIDIDRWSAPNITERILGVQNKTDTFSIYAQVCLPETAKDKHVMQILSHGIAFDHRYCKLCVAANNHLLNALADTSAPHCSQRRYTSS